MLANGPTSGSPLNMTASGNSFAVSCRDKRAAPINSPRTVAAQWRAAASSASLQLSADILGRNGDSFHAKTRSRKMASILLWSSGSTRPNTISSMSSEDLHATAFGVASQGERHRGSRKSFSSSTSDGTVYAR